MKRYLLRLAVAIHLTAFVASAQVANGTYALFNQASNLALVDAGYSTTSHTAVQQWPNDGGSASLWTITAVGNGYYSLINQVSGWALVDAGSSTTSHTAIQQWPYDGGSMN